MMYSNFSVFGLKPSRCFSRVRLLPFRFREPDHPRAIDIDVVVAVARIGQHVRFLRAGARIELDETIRITAIRQPDVAVGVEAHVLTDPPTGELTFPRAEFRSVDPLTRRVRREVVLDELGFAELCFVERDLLVDLHRLRLRRRPEVRDQVLQQRLAILAREAQRRRTVRQQPFRIRGWRLVEEVLPHHAIEPQVPGADRGRLRRQEVFAVADHAGPFGDVAPRSRWIDLVVALFEADPRHPLAFALVRVDDGAIRGGGGLRERQRHLRALAGFDGQPLHVRLQLSGRGADLVVAREQRDRAEALRVRVDHVEHPLVRVADEHLRGGIGSGGLDGARHRCRTRRPLRSAPLEIWST